eukprot:2276414-Heterocapsa_arctica.AAC.1
MRYDPVGHHPLVVVPPGAAEPRRLRRLHSGPRQPLGHPVLPGVRGPHCAGMAWAGRRGRGALLQGVHPGGRERQGRQA